MSNIDWSQKETEGELLAKRLFDMKVAKIHALHDVYEVRNALNDLPCNYFMAVSIIRMTKNLKTNKATEDAKHNVGAVRDAEGVIDSLTTIAQVENYDIETMPDWA